MPVGSNCACLHTSSSDRFLSPDDGSDQEPGDPQSWNLYSYVRNSPVSHVDPDGHDCVYLNDAGDSVENTDNQSSPSECQSTGGAWADGTITNVTTDPNSNNILIQTAQREDNGNIGYVTTETAPGQWSPGTELDQVAAGVNALHTNDFIAAAAAGSVAVGGLAGGLLYAMSGPGMMSLGLEAPGTGQAININPNDLIHIFGKATHNLSGLVARLGSERAAYAAIVEAVQREIASNGMTGVFEITLDVAGEPVTVRGKMVDGIAKIGTAFIR